MSRWTRFPIPLGQGVDTKSDDKSLQPGKLTTLENAVFTSPGRLRKRNGLQSFGTGTLGMTGSITNGVAVAGYNTETLLFTTGAMYSYVAPNNAWLFKGNITSLSTTTSQIIRNGYSQQNPDVAISGSLELYAWEDSQTTVDGTGKGANASGVGILCSVIDSVSRATVMPPTVVVPSGSSPQCFLFSGSLYVSYARNDNPGNQGFLCARRIDSSNPTILQPEVTLLSDVMFVASRITPAGATGDSRWVSVTPNDTKLFVVYSYKSTANGSVKVSQFVSQSLTFLTSSIIKQTSGTFPGGVDVVTTYAVGSWTDPSRNFWWCAASGSGFAPPANTPIVGGALDFTGNTLITASLIASTSATTVNLTGISTTGSISTFYFENSSSRGINRSIGNGTYGVARLPTSGAFARSVGLASKPFANGAAHYLWTNFDSNEQPTYFLMDADRNIVSKANPTIAGPGRDAQTLSNAVSASAGEVRFAGCRRDPVQVETGSLFTNNGVTSTLIDFTTTSGSFNSVLFGNQLLVAGGILNSYDGVNLVEHGFHVYPEQLVVSHTMGSTFGNILPGLRSYVATYEWMDNFGQMHRSETSLPLTVQFPFVNNIVGVSTGSTTITVPSLRLSAKSAKSVAQVGLYRTEDLGQTFYKVTSAVFPLFNSASLDTVTFTDTRSDAELISRELLYTLGGVLDNAAPMECKLITTFKNRAWLGGLEDVNVLQYSKTIVEGHPPEFANELTVRIDASNGAITALQGLEDVLVVFKERGIHVVYPLTNQGTPFGGGPDNTGAGGEWAQKPVVSDVGCINPNSLCSTDQGIFFESAKGICLIDRGLTVSYVGAAVEAFNNLTITAATLVANANHVRFSTNDGVCLVYDYLMNQWSTFTNHQSVDAVVVNGTYSILRSNGLVMHENNGTFNDDGAFIRMAPETGWISPFGPQGYMRAKSVSILGDYEGSHLLNIYVAYDYNINVWHTCSIDATSVVSQAPTREGNMYEFRAHFPIQKCTAIKLRIEDALSGSVTRGYSIGHLSVDVKQKQGSNRMRPARNRGAT